MTEWFDRRAGEAVSQHEEDPKMFLVDDSPPEKIRTPVELGFAGGIETNVIDYFSEMCPKCNKSMANHYVTDLVKAAKRYQVAECLGKESCGFVWYTLAEKG